VALVEPLDDCRQHVHVIAQAPQARELAANLAQRGEDQILLVVAQVLLLVLAASSVQETHNQAADDAAGGEYRDCSGDGLDHQAARLIGLELAHLLGTVLDIEQQQIPFGALLRLLCGERRLRDRHWSLLIKARRHTRSVRSNSPVEFTVNRRI